MKKITVYLILPLIFLAFVIFSCKKDKNENSSSKGQIEFSFINPVPTSNAKAASDSSASPITGAIVTIEDASGNVVINSLTINLSSINGEFISTPLALVTGTYQLSEFLIINQKNQVMYASPLKSSKLAYLVTNPLPISIDVQTNVVTKVTPEVISTQGSNPQDFGYGTFGFTIDSTFNFLVSTFIYNPLANNYQLTTASMAIFTDSELVYTTQLTGTKSTNPSYTSPFDSLGTMNNITLPAKYNTFTVVISKANFVAYKQTFTKAQLRLYFSSTNKGPLIVILNAPGSSSLTDGLVAYYPFNGDVLDHSGNGNNGTAYGTLTQVADHKGNANAAYYFNGVNSYVEVPDAPSLNPTTQMTVAAWYCAVNSWVGAGSDPIVDKPLATSASPAYQYHLGVTGNQYWNTPCNFGFEIDLNNQFITVNTKLSTPFTMGKWYHLVNTYDGISMKIYVNSVLVDSIAASGPMLGYVQNLYIGRYGNYNTNIQGYYFLPGNMNEIRIYNRALSKIEINSLYQY